MAIIVKSGTFDPKLEGLKLSPEVKAFLARKVHGAILYVDTDRWVDRGALAKICKEKMEGNGLSTALKVSNYYLYEGNRETLIAKATKLLPALILQSEFPGLKWRLIFTELFLPDPIRTFYCDADYDLSHAKGKSCIAWVKPYSGSDWGKSQKYPMTEFIHTKDTDPSLIKIKLGPISRRQP